MRVANCKIICREIEEADAAQDVTASVMQHLQGCPQCRAFYEGRLKLRSMVASLGTVEAPPDFDFRVRSRIAKERAGTNSVFFSSFSLSFPSVVLATLLLILGLGFALLSTKSPSTGTAVKTSDAPIPNKSNTLAADQKTASPIQEVTSKGNLDTNKETPRLPVSPGQGDGNRNRVFKSTVAAEGGKRRQATREFSSTPAPVVKRDEAIASLEASPIFPVEASSQPLKLSLDYDGVSRTISVPALSFGSQRVLAVGGPSLTKTASKGVW
ncbi:MAG: anti-sigma factor family protein [Pyrinomonadaceae bacterium]